MDKRKLFHNFIEKTKLFVLILRYIKCSKASMILGVMFSSTALDVSFVYFRYYCSKLKSPIFGKQ